MLDDKYKRCLFKKEEKGSRGSVAFIHHFKAYLWQKETHYLKENKTDNREPGMKWLGNKRTSCANFGFQNYKRKRVKRKRKDTWQYVCNYNNAEYKYSRVWLREKTNMHIKTLHAQFKAPPRLYRFNIKFDLSKSIQITGGERVLISNYSWLMQYILVVFFSSNIPDLVPSMLKIWTLRTEMGHWLLVKMSLKGKWTPTKVKWVWVRSIDCRETLTDTKSTG